MYLQENVFFYVPRSLVTMLSLDNEQRNIVSKKTVFPRYFFYLSWIFVYFNQENQTLRLSVLSLVLTTHFFGTDLFFRRNQVMVATRVIRKKTLFP